MSPLTLCKIWWWATEIDVIARRDSSRFEFEKNFGGISFKEMAPRDPEKYIIVSWACNRICDLFWHLIGWKIGSKDIAQWEFYTIWYVCRFRTENILDGMSWQEHKVLPYILPTCWERIWQCIRISILRLILYILSASIILEAEWCMYALVH